MVDTKRLTHGGAGSIQRAFHSIVPFQPPLNISWLDFLSPHTELEVPLVAFNKAPLLAKSDYSLHLLWFDVLVELPASQARSILANSE